MIVQAESPKHSNILNTYSTYARSNTHNEVHAPKMGPLGLLYLDIIGGDRSLLVVGVGTWISKVGIAPYL